MDVVVTLVGGEGPGSRARGLVARFPASRPGSVVVESILAFREGTTSANEVEAQFLRHEWEADRYDLVISGVRGEATPVACFGPARRRPAGPSLSSIWR